MNQATDQKKNGADSALSESNIRVTIVPDKMTATIRIPWPSEDNPPPTPDEIKQALNTHKISFGIDEELIEKIVTDSLYDQDITIATGKQPVKGLDAQLEYKFEEIQKLQPKEDDEGRIDYKDISFVRCTEKDQLLVVKSPANEGIPGTNVLGEKVSAKTGKDIKLPAGQNTRISDNGLELYADCNGSLVTSGRRINVNEIHIIGGGVNTKTGNIKHNGSLIIKGSVEANYEVIAKGDIEIYKNVEDAKIISGGSIMVKGGFWGSRNGLLKAATDVHCKYVDDQIIGAGHAIYVGGEVFNSLLTAHERVIVKGSKGRIVGGKIMAGDEIKATILGSEAGTRTKLQVAYNAELMKKYRTVINEIKQLNENEERVNEGLYAFYRLQMDGKLAPNKEAALKKLEAFKKNLPAQKEKFAKQKEALETKIQQNQNAKIIAIKKVYPGVVLHFGIIYKEITDEMGPSLFQLSGGTITHGEFKPGKGDF
ncbi:MAG: FapA family protein [candidate division Zixibacteria bacterium]